MFAFFAAAVLSALIPLASAKLTITEPTGAGWVGNSTVTVAWTWNNGDPNFSIELGNPYIQSGLLAAGPYAVGNNINPNVNSFSFELPTVPAGPNYFIAFVAIDNVNEVYANSTSFSISYNPSSTVPVPITTSSTGGGGSKTKTSAITSKTAVSLNNTLTGTSTGSGTSTGAPTSATPTSSFTQLVITTLTSSTPTPTKSAAGQVVSLNTMALAGVVGAVGAAVFGAFAL